MFYDLPNPLKFAEDVYSSLDNEGVWHLEQSYAKNTKFFYCKIN